MAEIEKISADRYRIRSHDHIMTVTAQDLRDIEAYATLHMAELEREARIADAIRRNQAMELAPNEIEDVSEDVSERDIQASAWRAIEAQAKIDLEAIQTDQDAYAFMDKYLSRELRHQYVQIYRSDRHEMNRTPQQAIKNLLSLPPL